MIDVYIDNKFFGKFESQQSDEDGDIFDKLEDTISEMAKSSNKKDIHTFRIEEGHSVQIYCLYFDTRINDWKFNRFTQFPL